MAKRKTAKRRRAPKRRRSLPGPTAREALPISDERDAQEELREFTETSPALTGGDVDADWKRAASMGEEAVGGTAATPDQDVVDDLGKAVGGPRAPDEAFRSASEILDARDRDRGAQEE
jgi:hypothetical protein